MKDKEKQQFLDQLHQLCRLFIPNVSVTYQYRDIHGKNVNLDLKIEDCFTYLRTAIKYSLFDSESFKRELDELRRQDG